MHVILALITDSPYRHAILRVADNLADLLDGCVRLAVLAQAQSLDDKGSISESDATQETFVRRAKSLS
ncbi:MAG: hypothetical protein ACUVX8_11760 [Candidatus Zipacnadales bacterium]